MELEELRLVIRTVLDEAGITQAKKKTAELNKELKGTAKAPQATNESMKELQETMEKVRNLDFADLILDHFDQIKLKVGEVKKSFAGAAGWFKLAGKEYADAFDFKNMDFGEDGIKGIAGSIKTSFANAFESTKRGLKHLGLGFKELGKVAKEAMKSTIAQVVALAASVLALVSAIRNAITVSLQMKNTFFKATSFGLSTESFQQWEYIMTTIGGEIDDLGDAIKTLSAEQALLAEGTEGNAKAFEELGMSVKDILSMSQEELFLNTIKNLQNVEDQVRKTQLAYQIFGEDDAARLTNLLSMNNEEIERLISNFYMLGGSASDSLIKKSNILQYSLQNLRTAWQGLKNTLAEAFMPVIKAVVDWLTKAVTAINMFMRAVFGYEIISKGSAASVKSSSSGLNGYTDSVKNATDAVNKLKRTTMGFDELNIVANPNSAANENSNTSLPSGTADLGNFEAIGSLTEGLEKLNLDGMFKKFSKWKDEIRALVPIAMIGVGAIGAVLAALSGHWGLAVLFASMAGFGLMAMTGGEGGFSGYIDSFNTACNGMLAPALVGVGAVGMVIFALMGNWIGAIACGALAGLSLYAISKDDGLNFDGFAQKCRDAVAPALIGVGAVGAVLALLLGNIPMGLACLALIGGGVALAANDNFSTLTTGFGKQVTQIVSIALIGIGVVGGLISLLMGNIPVAVGCLAMALIGIAGLGVANGWWDQISNAIKKWFEDLKKWFTQKVAPVFTKEFWRQKFETIKQGASEKLEEVKNNLNAKWEGVRNWFRTVVAPIFTKQYWLNKMDSIRQGLQEKFPEAYRVITSTWDTLKNWFNTNVKPKFTKQYWVDKFKSIKDGLKETFNGAIGIVETAINNIINKINTLSWKIPDWVPKVGGEKFGFNIKQVSIPRLAEGGIVTNSILANIGENGREAVLPLDNNTSWMDAFAEKVASKMRTPSRIVMNVDGRELGWATINSINGITQQTGEVQLVI